VEGNFCASAATTAGSCSGDGADGSVSMATSPSGSSLPGQASSEPGFIEANTDYFELLWMANVNVNVTTRSSSLARATRPPVAPWPILGDAAPARAMRCDPG